MTMGAESTGRVDGTEPASELPIACALSEPERVRRREEVAAEVFGGVRRVRELADGYAFQYPGDGDWAGKLLEFVAFERGCCPFFTFELVFEPEQGPIWLRLRGPDGVKDFIRGFATVPD
jgi:hypothetical protein